MSTERDGSVSLWSTPEPGVVKLWIADTGETKEWDGAGVEDDEPWRVSSLQLALNLVEDIADAIDRGRIRREGCTVTITFRDATPNTREASE